MPGRNTLKVYAPDTYYHLYNRGLNKGTIFIDRDDYDYFEWLLARSLSPKPVKDKKGREYVWLRDKMTLHAYCLMPNHFHLFVHQKNPESITKLISSVGTAYSLYFNKRYSRRGPLFENTYRAVSIYKESQLLHITRYIHLNHADFRGWPYSSYRDYIDSTRDWIEPQTILDMFESREQYRGFIADYESTQRLNNKLKREFADYL